MDALRNSVRNDSKPETKKGPTLVMNSTPKASARKPSKSVRPAARRNTA